MSLLALKGKWLKPRDVDGKEVAVNITVRGFGQASIADTGAVRPVAIVQEEGGCLRYVELKYVQVEGEVRNDG